MKNTFYKIIKQKEYIFKIIKDTVESHEKKRRAAKQSNQKSAQIRSLIKGIQQKNQGMFHNSRLVNKYAKVQTIRDTDDILREY